jgi:WD40 repeat protein
VRCSTVIVALRYKVLAYRVGNQDSVSSASRDVKGKSKAASGFRLDKVGEWETAENEMGMSAPEPELMIGLVAVATSPASTLLAMPGRQAGHVQLVSLPPCLPLATTSSIPQPQFRSPIILAHNHPLSTLACTANGSHVLTTSERGTLLRVWDTSRGRLERELRRGVDRADMWGVKFEDEVIEGDKARKGGMVVGWSDKGTIHVWEGEKAGELSKP